MRRRPDISEAERAGAPPLYASFLSSSLENASNLRLRGGGSSLVRTILRHFSNANEIIGDLVDAYAAVDRYKMGT